MKNNIYYFLAIFLSLFGLTVNAQTLNETQGTGAGAQISSGDFNTLYGDSSGTNLTSGGSHTFIGAWSGYSMTTSGNTTNGPASYTLTTPSNSGFVINPTGGNVFVGMSSGYFNTSGLDNVFIGTYAGYNNLSATDNTFIGAKAGFSNTTGVDNVFIGEEAGASNINGSDNVFIGENAGFSNTANDNTFIGNMSGNQNTTGRQNTFVGNEAGWDNTTGFWNTCLGDSAGVDNSVGIENTFIGHASGAATEYTSYNTFVGSYSGYDNNRYNVSNGTEAMYNTYLGSRSGFTNRRGNGNVMLGFNADFFGVGANEDNVVIGREAMVGGTSFLNGKSGVIAIGAFSRVDADYSVGIGYGTRVQGLRTISIGYEADIAANDDDNTIVGYQPSISGDRTSVFGSGSSSLNNDATALGFAASADSMSTAIGSTASATGNYSVAIGAGATTSQNNTMVLGGATNVDRVTVGIGTSAPNTNSSLDLSDTDKGFLLNRMTTALRTTLGGGLAAADQGLMVYDTDENVLYSWDGTQWNSATNTDNQDLSLVGNDLSITNGVTTIDLSGYLDNTDAQNLSLVGTTLSIDNGNSVDLSGIDTDTQLTEAQVDAYVANNGYLTSFTELDGDPLNEIQDISLAGTNLSITSGSTIDLSVIDTDTQLTEAQVDNYVSNNGYLTSFTEVDGDPLNEIQDISLAGTNLTISSGSTIDLSVIDTDTQIDSTGIAALGFVAGPHTVDTDDQTLSLAGNTLTIADGNSVDLSALTVGSDDQNLTAATLTGTTLQIEIENGTSVSVDLAPLLTGLQNQINLIDDRVTILEGCACDSTAGIVAPIGGGYIESPILYQNIPNPFNNTSSIKYFIPGWVNSANLVISDSFGKLVSNITLNERGTYGTQYVNADGLAPGNYFYTLYIDQTLFDTKKMIVE